MTLGISIAFIQPSSVTTRSPVTFSPVLYASMAGLMLVTLCNLFIFGWWLRFRLTKYYGWFLISVWVLIILCIDVPMEVVLNS